MHAPIDRRDALIQYNLILQELSNRKLRKMFKTPGHYDPNGQWIGGLYSFVRYFWDVLEPETDYVDGWPIWAICEHLEAVSDGRIKRLLINVPPGFSKSLITSVFWPAHQWAIGNAGHRFVTFSYSSKLTERDNNRFADLITSKKYQGLYANVVQVRKTGATLVSNSRHGWKFASSVGGTSTGVRGTIIVCDDPNAVREAESDTVRNDTNQWFRESMSNRLNSISTGAIVVIMQRVHEEDVSGTILSLGLDYTHLMIPMMYDVSRAESSPGVPYATDIGWVDPRYDADNLDACDGVLAWPERFDPDSVAKMQKTVDSHAWCNPYEAPILMADLSMRPIGTVKAGDQVIGFKIGNNAERARHTTATVLSVSKSVQPTVRITLSSGEVIRCTANHKWWTGRSQGRAIYAPARAPGVLNGKMAGGSVLRRICPPKVRGVEDLDDARAAGWLAGFFDGEGSVSEMHRRGSYKTALISFYQTADRNLPLCEKLEACLTKFGFEFSVVHKQRREGWQPSRHYWLRSDAIEGKTRGGADKRFSRLAMYQRFLHIVQPVKWRDRIIAAAAQGRVFSSRERVVSIEPDVTETVYGLETTTGNYVVWGLASSNSGQYQQAPAPRGGGLFKTDWWQIWESTDGRFPTFEYLVASLDSAFTEDQKNDPSGLTIWGVFLKEGKRRLMLVHAWRKHLEFSGPRDEQRKGETKQAWAARTQPKWGLMEWLAYTCERFNIDKLLIEGKASGISAAQELRNRYGLQPWSVQLCAVKGDKYARALAVQPIISGGGVYAPEREWADMVIQEMAVFPVGRYDDLTDSCTQALKHLRDIGMAPTDQEVAEAERSNVTHRGRASSLYPV